jgi:hypothetical protein
VVDGTEIYCRDKAVPEPDLDSNALRTPQKEQTLLVSIKRDRSSTQLLIYVQGKNNWFLEAIFLDEE